MCGRLHMLTLPLLETGAGWLQRIPPLPCCHHPAAAHPHALTWLSSTSHSPSLPTTRNSSPSCSASSVTSGMEVTGSPVKCLQAAARPGRCEPSKSCRGKTSCQASANKLPRQTSCGARNATAGWHSRVPAGTSTPLWPPPAVSEGLVPQLEVDALLQQQLQALLPLELHVAKGPGAAGVGGAAAKQASALLPGQKIPSSCCSSCAKPAGTMPQQQQNSLLQSTSPAAPCSRHTC